MTAAEHPTALISYSHDSPEHERRVLELCNRLRDRGIDALVDQFLSGAPSEGWPLWMERQIEQRDFTLMVCTETYRRRFMEDQAGVAGRGVVWEARILRNLLYENAERHGRFVPVLLDPNAGAFVPTVFRGHFYDLSDERGFEGLLRHLLHEPGAEAAALGALGPQGSRWSAFERPWLVPETVRTPYFTGRERVLESLRRQLTERGRAALGGLGGVGKTQTAIEYALRHRTEYPDGVFWTSAETASALTGGFVEIAKSLRLASAASSDQEQVVRAVLDWLNGTHRWLLILDNVDDRRTIRPFVPERGAGHVLMTSRESVFQEFGVARALDVADLDEDEAVRFLFMRSGRDAVDAPERAAAGQLATELGHLPLALEQAAAYVAETNASFSDYLASFRKRRVTLLERASDLMSRETVAVTWAANFEAVERASPAAADTLRTSAFLNSDSIPFEVFERGAEVLGAPIEAALAGADELAMAELLRPLARYSLVRSDVSLRAYGVHRLVQEMVRASLTPSERRRYAERAVCALDAVFPEVEYASWAQCDRLLPHVLSIVGWIDSFGVSVEAAGRVLHQAGLYLRERGRYAEAEGLHGRALAIRESALGPDHPDVAKSLAGLAIVHWDRGRYDEAQQLNQRALSIRERALGPDHADVASSLNSLALVRWNQGRYEEAQRLYERALAIREKALGLDHLRVATSLNNLAIVHSDQGRPAEAARLHERALAIRERALGSEHPDVGQSLIGLANTHWRLGRYADAQPLYERARDILERALGPDHPHVALSLGNLADLHCKLGRYAEALPLYERALAIRERALGADHPDVAQTLIGLASLHEDEGRKAEAVILLERALNISERTHAGDPELAELRDRLDVLRRPP